MLIMYKIDETPKEGEISFIINKIKANFIIGHPTYNNQDNIGSLIEKDIKGILKYIKENSLIIISDGTKTIENDDKSVFEAIEKIFPILKEKYEQNLNNLNIDVAILVSMYDGYMGNRIPGKGSALKLIYSEVYNSNFGEFLTLLDGDLRNDVNEWIGVYKKIIEYHKENFGDKPLFVTAKYARHFVDASLTRFIVSPLTTGFGMFVPGGISGDIFLNKKAVENEIKAKWSENRYKYGTDISTTIDNIVNGTIIYEAYLGAKLHDITDEAKLAIMPREVIGAILEKFIEKEKENGIISKIKQEKLELKFPIIFDSSKTGIDFIDPGYTDVFNIDVKTTNLIEKFIDYKNSIEKVFGTSFAKEIEKRVEKLKENYKNENNKILFLDINRDLWIDILNKALNYILSTEDVENTKTALSYLYTASFLEFVKEKLEFLNIKTYKEIRKKQKKLGVPKEIAKEFYEKEVDEKIKDMSIKFYNLFIGG